MTPYCLHILIDAMSLKPVTLADDHGQKALVFFQSEQVAEVYIREQGLVGLIPRCLGYAEMTTLYSFAIASQFTTVVKWWGTGDGGIVSEEEPLFPE